MEPIDLTLRTMAAVHLLFPAAVLLVRRERTRTTHAAAWLPLVLVACLALSAPGADDWAAGLLLSLTVLWVANPLWTWLLGEALFTDEIRIELRWLGPALVLAIACAWGGMAGSDAGHRLAVGVLQAGAAGAVLATVWMIWRGKRGPQAPARRRWRSWVVAGVGAYGLVALASLAIFGAALPPPLAQAHVAFILACGLFLSVHLALRLDASDARGCDEPVATISTPPAKTMNEALVATILHAMEVDRLYRRESLTVAELARAIGSQEYRVRRAINGDLGYRNFNEFLHGFRLGEAAPRLLSQPDLPILSIALDVGYGSIGPFNRAFRARFGMTPSEYRAQVLPEPPSAARA